MQSQVLWTIDKELDGSKFERLCVDLLFRNGYKDIVPIEPQDGGRDAEELPRKGRDREGCPSFFQFSKETGWKPKIRTDAAKLHARGAQFTYLVFVSSQRVRGIDIDQLRAEFRKLYGWTLIVFSREWLRLQLEEANTDLTKKYLGIRIESRAKTPSWLIKPNQKIGAALKAVVRAMESGAFPRAIDLLEGFLGTQPESAVAWQLLAWANYRLEHFDDALAHINRALKLNNEPHFDLIRACILAERGIRDGIKAELQLAESLFRAGLERIGNAPDDEKWMVHYNLGNVLSALRKHSEAVEQFQASLKFDKDRPEIWKNLGSALHESGDHKAEVKCLNKALELNPLLPEALASRAISFIVDDLKPQEAVPLLEAAFRSQPAIATRWAKFWYWLVTGCLKANELTQALSWVEEGLRHQPGSRSLKHLKSEVLAKLKDSDSAWGAAAHEFWSRELMAEAMNFEARRQLALAEFAAGNIDIAWTLVDECLPLFNFDEGFSCKELRLDLTDCLAAVEFLPQYIKFRISLPLPEVWNRAHSKLFTDEMNLDVLNALSAYLAIPFGIGFRRMKEEQSDLTTFFDSIRQPLIASFVAAARRFSPAIALVLNRPKQVSKLVTAAGAVLTDAAQYEFTHQAYYIAGIGGHESEQVASSFVAYKRISVVPEVLAGSITELVQMNPPRAKAAKPKKKVRGRR